MIDIDEAQRVVLSHVRPLDTEQVPLGEAGMRTLAEAVRCDIDMPPFDRAVMDGYAVRAIDTIAAPLRLRVVGRSAAGGSGTCSVEAGEAVKINTGAPMPAGADAVVRIEATELSVSNAEVVVRESVTPGRFVTPKAAYVTAGSVILPNGTVLGPTEIAAAATAGVATVTVYRQPVVAILSTGDELIEVDRKPAGAQIRNSNQYVLQALAESAHCKIRLLGVAGDDENQLRCKIDAGLSADVLCITGGVSMGDRDLVPDVLAAAGATIHVRKISIKPGRPTLFATGRGGALVFGLPGNPASAFVVFELLVRSAIAALQGRTGEAPKPTRVRLHGTLAATSARQTYHPARVSISDDGELVARTLSWQGSGDAIGMVGANGLMVREPNTRAVGDGETVRALLLSAPVSSGPNDSPWGSQYCTARTD